MSLIAVNAHDIILGEPLPWPLFDRDHHSLLAQGDVVRDLAHFEEIQGNGLFREMAWKSGGGNGAVPSADKTASQSSAENGTRFTFDDMKLKPEDRLQLQPPSNMMVTDRYLVRVIGFLRDSSLLVSAPITTNGLRLPIRENEKVVLRSFSGQNAFGFACKIERVCKIPYEYLHLSFPEEIQGITVRKAPRIKTRIIASVQNISRGDAEHQASALISNISANGVALDAKQPLASKGDTLDMMFRVRLHQVDAYLSIKGLVCAIFNTDPDSAHKTGVIRHGIEFKDLPPNDSVILQSMIYQEMIENPANLM